MLDSDPRSPYIANQGPHPWRRMVSIGDSFTEGIGDPDPGAPDGHRGWADRVAEQLAQEVDEFAYANLAVRGKLIRQIRDEQLDQALALSPDLVTICAGGNDVLRPGTDPDEIAEIFAACVGKLCGTGATVVVFTGFDVGWNPVFKTFRGKIAIYNENMRAIAEKHDAIVADLWSLQEVKDSRFWADDRLHLNPLGHHEVARLVLRALNVPNSLMPLQPDPLPERTWRAARRDDLVWARTHLVPWVLRRLRHQSSGDGVLPKRPEAAPMIGGDAGA